MQTHLYLMMYMDGYPSIALHCSILIDVEYMLFVLSIALEFNVG
jgi:hypothetical protein